VVQELAHEVYVNIKEQKFDGKINPTIMDLNDSLLDNITSYMLED
jgi:hypothetical protein